MSELRLVVFDVDGTLIDSQEFILEAFALAFDRSGLQPLPRDQVLSIVGLSLVEAVQVLVPDLNEREAQEVAQLYKQSFIDLRAQKGGEGAAPLYAGARDLLETLHEQPETLLGVATGKARRGLDHAYQAHGIGHFFTTHQTADDHPSKPHPSLLERALSETGTDARNGVMIGDTEFDIRMGAAAGMRTIAVDWGYHPEERLRASEPDHYVHDFIELRQLLAEIEERIA